MKIFLYSFQSEWLKKKRSAAAWLTISGAFFTPLIFLIYQLMHFDALYSLSQKSDYWESVFNHCWEFVGIMLLPLGMIIAASLVTQLEYRNNTWKQIHATPQSLSTLFFAKFSLIGVMLIQFFILFDLGVYLCGILPSVIFRGIPFPKETIPFGLILKYNLKCFIDSLPILAFQYLTGLQFKNFFIPLCLGIGLYVGSMMAISWKYGYILPYIYEPLNILHKQGVIDRTINMHFLAVIYFISFIVLGYILFITKKEKG